MLEKIVPEIVEAAPHDEVAPRKSHDLPDTAPVLAAVAVDMALFAGGLRVQGAAAAFFHGVGHQPGTVLTEIQTRGMDGRQLRRYGNRHLRLAAMPGTAIDRDKGDENLHVLALLWRKFAHGNIV
jgi:hypothetical protein